MKRFIISSLMIFSLGMTTLSFAEGDLPNPMPSRSSFDAYIGLQGGGEFFNVKKSIDLNSVIQDYQQQNILINFLDASSAFSGIGADIGTYLGVGGRFGRWDLYGELGIDGLSGETNINTTDTYVRDTNVTAHEKLKYSYNLSILPGIYIAPNNKLFFRLGLAGAEFSTQSNGFANGFAYSADDLYNTSGRFHKNVWGYRLGLGVESFFTHHISLRAEYDFTQYQNINTTQHLYYKNSETEAEFLNTLSFKPYTNIILLGLTYHLQSLNS